MNSGVINWYISSDNQMYDITSVNTERLINSLSKHHRDVYSSKDNNETMRHYEQINLIEKELNRRSLEFNSKKGE